MTTPKTLNIALVGTKFMGRAHSNAYLKVAKFFDLPRSPVMHTVVARDVAYARQFAQRWGWQNATADFDAVLADPTIDLVDIGVPNNAHRDLALAALAAGKHVACEKPLADTLDSARAMRAAARKARKCQTFVWYNYRRCPAVALAYQLAREGRLGRIYQVRASFLQDWAGPDTPMLWRFQGDVAGSGSLGDLGAHCIDTARFITGEELTEIGGAYLETVVKERTVLASQSASGGEIAGKGARTVGQKQKSTVDDIVAFTARMSGGAIATFEATRLATGYKNSNRIEIHGDKGALRFNFERLAELDFYDATLPGHVQGWSTINVSSGGDGHPYAANWWPTAHAIGYEHSFVNMAADVIKTLGGETPLVPLPDFADAYQTQRVLAAVTLSARNRRPVKLKDVK